MISRQPNDERATGASTEPHEQRPTVLTHDSVLNLFREAVEDALEESRRMGIPIPVGGEGETKYELPDGSVVDHDPWLGKPTAPEGWYERFGIQPPARKASDAG